MSLEAIKAKLLEQQAKSKGGGDRTTQGTGGDNASYPFWNIPEGSEATVRFLPDKDPNNTFFWQKREVIKMPFDGVDGGDYPTDKPVTVTVPCVEMWGETCPIISATRPWWKDGREALARQYWKKKSYIFQGFVVNSPLDEKEGKPENPIRRFVINPSIYEIIEKSLMNPEMEDMPTDYVGGRDFKITKTKKGEYANYSTSSWSFRTRSLSETEAVAIEQHGLWNLSDYLGRRPDADELEALKAMFQDSVDGKPFDTASFGKYYRAFGGRGGDDAAPAAAPIGRTETPASTYQRAASAPAETVAESAPAERVYESDPAPAAAASSGEKPNVNEILDRIKNRTLNKS